jgi:hypothetical protein
MGPKKHSRNLANNIGGRGGGGGKIAHGDWELGCRYFACGKPAGFIFWGGVNPPK